MGTGLVLETVRRGLRSLTRFAVFCDRADVEEVAEVDRDLLERYLADLAVEPVVESTSHTESSTTHVWAANSPISQVIVEASLRSRLL